MILVVGPGALGLLLAGLLGERGLEVTLLDHDPARAERLAAAGVALSGPGGQPERRVPVAARASARGLRPELIVCCVKVKDTGAALAALAGVSGPILILQNGLGRAEAAAALLGDPSRVLGGVTSEGASLLGEGRVAHAGRGPTAVGALPGQDPQPARAAVALLRQGGLLAEVAHDWPRPAFEKLQVNAAINALTGVLGRENGALLRSEAARALAQQAAEEVGRLAQVLSVPGDWGPGPSRARWEGVAEATSGNISSTLQDLRRGRPTEVHAINGAVAEALGAAGVAAPINAFLAHLVRAREELAQAIPPGPLLES